MIRENPSNSGTHLDSAAPSATTAPPPLPIGHRRAADDPVLRYMLEHREPPVRLEYDAFRGM